ncbi:hypothetical protein LCGC14_0414310 [marine sediment metagenome]|uniref:Uncharacterized protein n=1 Tax=marine sediment metagenome TaxID=412755 RepID=A0A0F9VEP3_9ZZZZ
MTQREAKRRVLRYWGAAMQIEIASFLLEEEDVEDDDWARLWDAQVELGDELIRRGESSPK